MGFPGNSVVTNLPANAGNMDPIPGLQRSPGGGNGKPLPCSCLGNPMDRGAWWATVHGVAKSRTRLSNLTITSSPKTTISHLLLQLVLLLQLLLVILLFLLFVLPQLWVSNTFFVLNTMLSAFWTVPCVTGEQYRWAALGKAVSSQREDPVCSVIRGS